MKCERLVALTGAAARAAPAKSLALLIPVL
jgi:hypothetical protein